MKLLNNSKNLVVTTDVKRADGYFSRLIGLLGTSSLSEEKALWLDPCNNIHMWFMRYALDVVFVGRDLKVCAVYEEVKPWRAIWYVKGAQSAFEMAVGSVKRVALKLETSCMWVIRFYTGALAGKQLPLKMGRNLVGRGAYCDVVLSTQGVSKEHASIEVYNDKILIKDLGSSNGTFVNGVLIKSHELVPGDRIGFHDILADVAQRKPKAKAGAARRPQPTYPNISGNVAVNQQLYDHSRPQVAEGDGVGVVAGLDPGLNPDEQQIDQPSPTLGQNVPPFVVYIQRYVDEVVLPGVYRLAEIMDLKVVIGLFVAAFIVLVTTLSTVPLMQILKSSIEQEAHNHALTIARNLAQYNRTALQQGLESSVSVEPSMREPGVNRAFVISNVNHDIIAPSQMAGQYMTEYPFVNNAIKSPTETVVQIDSKSVGAVVPIRFFNSATGTDTVAAFAVIIFDMGILAVDNGRTLSLFVEILFIAVLLGSILYFFLYRLVEQPLSDVNKKLVAALKEPGQEITTTYKSEHLHNLISSINNALLRPSGAFGADNLNKFEADRSLEMQNIVNLIGFPALTIQASDRMITAVNDHFTTHIGGHQTWLNVSVDKVLDQALKLNLQSLLEKVVAMPSQLATDQLEIANQNYELSAQGVHGSAAIAYVLIVFIPKGAASESAGTGPQLEHSLTVVNGPEKGTVYKLVSGRISLGRGADNTIIIKDDPKISRQHALIMVSAANVQITDLSDRQKTLVNGAPVRSAVLQPGAVVQLGETRFIYKTETPESSMVQIETVVQNPVISGLTNVRPNTGSVGRPRSKRQAGGNRTMFYVIVAVVILGAAWLASQKPKSGMTAVPPTDEQFQAQINSDQKIVTDLEAARQKEGKTTRSYEEAQGHFIRGFRDYQKGQYQHAMESFQACKSLFPEHEQCKKYYVLAQNKFDLLIQMQMILAIRYKDQGQFDACYATYRNVIGMLGDKTNRMYQEAIAGRDACQALGAKDING